jgi:hypothetical protein
MLNVVLSSIQKVAKLGIRAVYFEPLTVMQANECPSVFNSLAVKPPSVIQSSQTLGHPSHKANKSAKN